MISVLTLTRKDQSFIRRQPRTERIGIVTERRGVLASNGRLHHRPYALFAYDLTFGVIKCDVEANQVRLLRGAPSRWHGVLDVQHVINKSVLEEVSTRVRLRVVNTTKNLVDRVDGEGNGGTEHVFALCQLLETIPSRHEVIGRDHSLQC